MILFAQSRRAGRGKDSGRAPQKGDRPPAGNARPTPTGTKAEPASGRAPNPKVAQGKTSGTRTPRSRGAGARKSPPPAPGLSLTPAQQEQLAAIVLFVIALLTAMGALNLSGGNILDGWTRILSVLFGWGRLLAPIFFGGLGAWLFLDSLDRRPEIGWERPFGLIILFLFFEALFHLSYAGPTSLVSAQNGLGGGLIGYGLSDLLVGGLGMAGAIVVLFVVLCIGLLLFFNIPLSQIVGTLARSWQSLQQGLSHRTSQPRNSSGGTGRTPIEMITAPPRTPQISATNDGRRTTEEAPRIPADYAGLDEPLGLPSTQQAMRPPIAARIVGGASSGDAFNQRHVHREWRLPKTQDILEESIEQEISAQEIREKVKRIEETLAHFGVPAKVIEVNQGPTITQFGVEPGFLEQKGSDGAMRKVKVKVNRISALQHDLELALAASPIRVEAPVPGKSIVGIEVPNSQISRVSLRGVMESEEFNKVHTKSPLAFALGQDVSGQPIVADLGKMPHLLIAGATGSGKSVCVNALISCLIITNTPDDLKFVMVDPKRVELSSFNGIPHLLTPVVVEMDLAVAALQRTVQEMDDRYKRFSQVGARNIETYNALPEEKRRGPKMFYLIVVVDELADLMMIAPDDVERTITRLAQMARATGIHLVLATQRPSVDVVTGLIKANFPSRISFAVTSQIDSRVVLDTPGAEKLLGRGDMLYMASDSSKLLRLQGCFVSDRELDKLVTYWKAFIEGQPPSPLTPLPRGEGNVTQGNMPQARVAPSLIPRQTPNVSGQASNVNRPDASPSSDWVQSGLWNDLEASRKGKSEEDDLLDQAMALVQSNERVSISFLQRKLRIGYSRAARLMELLEQKGLVGPDEGPTKGREALPRGMMPPGAPPTFPVEQPPRVSKPPASRGAPSSSKSKPSTRGNLTPNPSPTRRGESEPRAAREDRDFEGMDDFDDWTDEDWADLDKD